MRSSQKSRGQVASAAHVLQEFPRGLLPKGIRYEIEIECKHVRGLGSLADRAIRVDELLLERLRDLGQRLTVPRRLLGLSKQFGRPGEQVGWGCQIGGGNQIGGG